MKYVDLNKNKFGKKKKLLTKKRAVFLLGVVLVLFLIHYSSFDFRSLLTPVSVFSQIINPRNLDQTDGRTNILALGVDRRSNAGYVSGTLTDTIMVASIDSQSKKATIISIPRDFWVKMDDYTSGKINSAYAFGGVGLTQKVVERVLGIPIHYFVVVDFKSFEEAINVLGGVEVNVENAFDDYKYPIFGKELDECDGDAELKCRYEHLHFDAGLQQMNGETALHFARSRHAEGVEGGDFARIARQQKVALAAKDKALSLETLAHPKKLKELYDLFSDSLETNVSFKEIERLYQLSRGFDGEKISSHVLSGAWDDENALLYTPEVELYGGAYVLVPKTGNYSEIHYFVQKLLFGSN
jgi:LCP family protein required for cell wall assembly